VVSQLAGNLTRDQIATLKDARKLRAECSLTGAFSALR
jgi:hypothetical protein